MATRRMLASIGFAQRLSKARIRIPAVERRLFSSSSSSSDAGKKTLKDIPTPKEISERQAFMKEKADRAKVIHSELEQLLANRSQRQQKEMSIGLIQRTVSHVYQNSGRFLNVAAALVMVLLAFQLVLLRQKEERAQLEAAEAVKKLEERGNLLQSLVTEEFCDQLAAEIVEDLKQHHPASTGSSSSYFGVSWNRPQQEPAMNDFQGDQSRVARLVARGLGRIIGNEGLSEPEKKERVLRTLKAQQGSTMTGNKDDSSEDLLLNAIISSEHNSSSQASGTVVENGEGGSKVTTKRVFSI